jgi:hypothetical protein
VLGVATASSAAASFADTAAFAAAFTGFGSRRGVVAAATIATAFDEHTSAARDDPATLPATAHIYGANADAITVSTVTTSARIAVGVAA